MKKEIKEFLPVAEAFVKLLHPFAEVVMHDLAKNKIEAIYNSFSHRNVGDSSYLDHLESEIHLNDNVIGPYEKINYNGHRLKSISIVLRDRSKKAIGFLCVNIDIAVFDNYQNTLQLFLLNSHVTDQNSMAFKDDLFEQINVFIQNYCREKKLNLDTLTREEKKSLSLVLKDNGAFNGKNATSYIARILNISRATVYNYLKEKE